MPFSVFRGTCLLERLGEGGEFRGEKREESNKEAVKSRDRYGKRGKGERKENPFNALL